MEIVEKQAKAILGDEELQTGGYRIYTTLDPVLQKAAEEGLRKRLLEVETRKGYAHPTYSAFDIEFKKWRRDAREGGDAPKPPARRLTLTLPILGAAGLRVILAVGATKHRLVERILGRGSPAQPLCHLPVPGSLVALLDQP